MYLFHRYPKQEEGFMTRLQTKLEDKNTLSQIHKDYYTSISNKSQHLFYLVDTRVLG